MSLRLILQVLSSSSCQIIYVFWFLKHAPVLSTKCRCVDRESTDLDINQAKLINVHAHICCRTSFHRTCSKVHCSFSAIAHQCARAGHKWQDSCVHAHKRVTIRKSQLCTKAHERGTRDKPHCSWGLPSQIQQILLVSLSLSVLSLIHI